MSEHIKTGEEPNLADQIEQHLRSVKNPRERRTIAELLRAVSNLPLEHVRAAIESSASIAAVSLRASIEFLRATPEAAHLLEPAELRAWGELGRRLTTNDVESGISFFTAGTAEFARVPAPVRPFVFQVCSRQMILSATIAAETFRDAPALADAVEDSELLRSIYEIAASISRRSAKHSAEFLTATPAVVAAVCETSGSKALPTSGEGLGGVERSANLSPTPLRTRRGAQSTADRQTIAGSSPPLNRNESLLIAAVELAKSFAEHAGGIAADAWVSIPAATARLDPDNALKLIRRARGFLERGGGAALQVLIAGGDILRTAPECFDEWVDLLWAVAAHGNAGLVAFTRTCPGVFRSIETETQHARAVDLVRRVISLTRDVARTDGESALACLRSSAKALRTVSIDQFEAWARAGLITSDMRTRRSYYALETRTSNDALRASDHGGVTLESIQHLLRLYVEGLTGRAVEIASVAAVPVEARIGDGSTIYLPAAVSDFGDDELDFRLYKVLAAHAAGQIEFGTYDQATDDLRAAYASLAARFDPANQDERAAFADDGYLPDIAAAEQGQSPSPHAERGWGEVGTRTNPTPSLPARGEGVRASYSDVLQLFPIPALARRIFGTLENGRIDRRLRRQYRGLNRDLDLIRAHLRSRRPKIIDLPATLVPFELLFQITMLGGALDDARDFYRQIVSELETVVADYLNDLNATVADTLMATGRVYDLFQSISMEDAEKQIEVPDEQDQEDASKLAEEMLAQRERDRQPQRRDARELFNAWNTEAEGEFDELEGSEAWSEGETPEHGLEEGEIAFNYDEWDRELTDHRVGWCRVVEKKVKRGSRTFVDETRERYKGVMSSIRHQFQLLKPENLTRIVNELDGEDYDLNAVVDYFIDRRADGQPSERIYTKRLRRRRDVAVSFLLDQSSSTARTIGRHPLQPYTHPGRRIIEIEKEGLVLMSEALEAVGDVYSINGFTSEGRRNVKFYVLKDFDEHYSDEVMRRIGGITYQNNTRLGAAIRHATAKLEQQEARTRLLIVLSDGRPYDHDYGDARYAREDTREALVNAKVRGITPFCITIDRESESELRDLYGEVGYTIIDDVLSLPERLPGIYRRLTT
ncbi:MAG TPA: VWA domain-containing protein [Pyrinomonadaceae bacterium]|nr:VWA domain-containing protein [Pyrinomonadaceae bacterium]